MHRFIAEEIITQAGQTVVLGAEESRHAARVLRLGPGEEVQLIDGRNLFSAILTEVTEKHTEARVTGMPPSPEAPCEAVLWQGLPKADKLELIVQKATELGASGVLPVVMERSVAKADRGDRDEKKQERFCRIALEAAKQSGRARVPAVKKPVSFQEALEEAAGFDLVLVAWEEEHALTFSGQVTQYLKEHGMPGKVLIVIGPEGGITPSECEALKAAGAKPVTLGPRILRTETAGLCALSVLWTALG